MTNFNILVPSTMEELNEKIKQLCEQDDIYSEKQLKANLKDYCGTCRQIFITDIPSRRDVVIVTGTVYEILSKKWCTERSNDASQERRRVNSCKYCEAGHSSSCLCRPCLP